MEQPIRTSLQALLEGISAGNGAVISQEMEQLEGMLRDHRAALHPQLVHFLERRSYAKAWQFLGGASDIPSGNCGGRERTGK